MYGHAAHLVKPCSLCPADTAQHATAITDDGALVCTAHALADPSLIGATS